MRKTFTFSESGLATRSIALLGTFPPRKCGIATFSSDLTEALKTVEPSLHVDHFVMVDEQGLKQPQVAHRTILDSNISDYRAAAHDLNSGNYATLLVQHEYGIFGGLAGDLVLHLLEKLDLPIITTLHTVLEHPSDQQGRVMNELVRLSSRLIVMSHRAAELLMSVYGVEPERIKLIPHGVPEVSGGSSSRGRQIMGDGRPLILTFGFLSPDKGIQHAIAAMPTILEKRPSAQYWIVGETHPSILRAQGDAYRHQLTQQVSDLGLTGSVKFIDRFVNQEELVDCLAATDYYITPYLNPQQVTSGTLAYAIGAGKVVISTPFLYAQEILADDRGRLVPFAAPDQLGRAVLEFDSDLDLRRQTEALAGELGSQMKWPQVGKMYLDEIDAVSPRRFSAEAGAVRLGEPNLQHLFDLSDDTGILQHSRYSVPLREEGYCVDDNARGLLLTLQLQESHPSQAMIDRLQGQYLAFVISAYSPFASMFRNFMSYQKAWLEIYGSEDSQGRSLWALGTCAARCHHEGRRLAAQSYFELAAPGISETRSPRSWAYGILGLSQYLGRFPNEIWAKDLMINLTERLVNGFEAYQRPDWNWCEDSLTYANARICQALMSAGNTASNGSWVRLGLESLRWLNKQQTDCQGRFSPIGSQGFFPRGGEKALFDQQPVEAAGTISSSLLAYELTGAPDWMHHATQAFKWFLGENSLQKALYTPENGGCYDGLHGDRLNLNQGAEATLSYLQAHSEICAAQSIRMNPIARSA